MGIRSIDRRRSSEPVPVTEPAFRSSDAITHAAGSPHLAAREFSVRFEQMSRPGPSHPDHRATPAVNLLLLGWWVCVGPGESCGVALAVHPGEDVEDANGRHRLVQARGVADGE